MDAGERRHLFEYFPGNFVWSQSMMSIIDMAAWGAASMGEVDQGSGRKPAVVCFDGLDLSKEMSVLFAGVELANRGVSTLAIDGPGQGEALRLRNLPSRHDYEVPGTAAYEYMAARPDVDASRVAIMAFSMGGYYAPRIAAFEKRYAALVAWGAHFDYHAVWVERWKHMQAGGKNASSAAFQLPFVMGTPDMDSALEKTRRYTLAGVAERIECPTLIVHGENDTIVPVHWAHTLYDAVGAGRKELKIFTVADGGSEHCHGDNRVVGSNFIADWLADTLHAGR